MDTAVGVIIVIAAFIYVFWPMFRTSASDRQAIPALENVRVSDLHQQKDRLFSTIQELDADYEIGNLSEKDYAELRQRYEEKAVSTLKELDQVKVETAEEAVPGIEDEIEQEVRTLRGRRTAEIQHAPGIACASCGAAISPEDNFCPQCGATAARFCSGCGAQAAPGANYCAKCGAPLGE